jgi:hypothetical protein
MKKSYCLAGRDYPTKAAVTAQCRSMLDGGPVDEVFLLDLLAMHPEYEQKVGVGVARFFVNPDGFGGRCFWLERLDGSKTDWSFRSCLTPPTHEQEVRSALRRLVMYQVLEFRDLAIETDARCAITGIQVTRHSAHVDHRPPKTFLSLVESFLAEVGLTYENISVQPTKDGSTTTELCDVELARRWQNFHAQHAVLQLTSARANLSQGGGR